MAEVQIQMTEMTARMAEMNMRMMALIAMEVQMTEMKTITSCLRFDAGSGEDGRDAWG